MVLVDYIGIFFTCGNTFGHILYKIFMKNVQFLRKNTACSEVLVHLKILKALRDAWSQTTKPLHKL